MKNPRVNVAVTTEQHSLLMELSALQGRSAASFLREMLDTAEPLLAAALPVWRTIAKETQAQPEMLRAAIQKALDQLDVNVEQLDLLKLLSCQQTIAGNDESGEERTERSEGAPQTKRRGRG